MEEVKNQKAFVGRAQWKINQPRSLKENEQAWREHLYHSMRAVKDGLPALSGESENHKTLATPF
jgi:hypothetical protein